MDFNTKFLNFRDNMLNKAKTATDPLSHNPTVYYKQAKYFSNQQDHANALFYLSLALDANMEEPDINIANLVMSTQALSLAKVKKSFVFPPIYIKNVTVHLYVCLFHLIPSSSSFLLKTGLLCQTWINLWLN